MTPLSLTIIILSEMGLCRLQSNTVPVFHPHLELFKSLLESNPVPYFPLDVY